MYKNTKRYVVDAKEDTKDKKLRKYAQIRYRWLWHNKNQTIYWWYFHVFTLNSWKILNGIWILHELKSSNFIHLPYIPICRARLTNFNEQTVVILSVLIISLFSSFIGSVVVLHWFHEYARFPKFDSAIFSGNLPAQFKLANLPNISDVERNHHSNLQVGTSILSDQLSN